MHALNLALAMVLFAMAPSAASAQPKPEPVKRPPPPNAGRPLLPSGGVVRMIDGESITIQGYMIMTRNEVEPKTTRGWNGRVRTRTITAKRMIVWGTVPEMEAIRLEDDGTNALKVTRPDGSLQIIRLDEQPLQRYLFSDVLKGGSFRPGIGSSHSYRIADVRVGDSVDLELRGRVCEAISIRGRPGGTIPPAPGEDPKAKRKHHEQMQALQDWREKGTPIPDKYHPKGRQAGIAPPPHEPKPGR